MTRRGTVSALLGVLAVACLVAPARSSALQIRCSASGPGGSWASEGRSASSSRVQDQEHDIKAPLLPLWTFDPRRWSHVTGQQFTGQPLVDAGCAYVASHRGSADGGDLPGWVYALNTGYGEVVWQRQVEGGVHGALAMSRDLVLAHVQGRSGPTVVALDRRTGATRWRSVVSRSRGALALASPVVLGSVVWVGVGGEHGASVLLDLRTGGLLRSTPVPAVAAAPAVDSATHLAYVPTRAGVLAVDVDRSRSSFGRIVARGPGASTSATPNLVAGTVVSVGDDGVLRVLRRRDLAALAEVLVAAAGPAGSTAAQGSTVYGASGTPGALWAVDTTTSRLRWITPTGDVLHPATPVSVANGVVYALDAAGDLVTVDARTGLLTWRLPMTVASETYGAQTASCAGVTIAEHLVLTASGLRNGADQNGFVVAYGPARL